MSTMDEYDREYMRGLLDMTDIETKDIIDRCQKILDNSYGISFHDQDIAYVIEAFEKAKAEAWSE